MFSWFCCCCKNYPIPPKHTSIFEILLCISYVVWVEQNIKYDQYLRIHWVIQCILIHLQFYDYWLGLKKYVDMNPLEFRQVEKNFQQQISQTVGSELKNSIMQNAIGPGAILLHSEMYGENILPDVIPNKQFKTLLEAASTVGIGGKTLQEW